MFDNAISQSGIPQLKSNGLMQEVERRDTSGMTRLADVDENTSLAAGTYSISSAEELAKLATMQNSGKIANGSEFVLGADIDLSAYSEGEGWTAIGVSFYGDEHVFSGTFDGNGYTISNLTINNGRYGQVEGNALSRMKVGLFGAVNNSTIKNVVLSDCDIDMSERKVMVGCLAAEVRGDNSSIINCTVSGNVVCSDEGMSGLLVSAITANVENCYATGNIKGGKTAGGIVQSCIGGTINNCYADVSITDSEVAGGIVGSCSSDLNITNCAASGKINGYTAAGGILGEKSWSRLRFGTVNISDSSFWGTTSADEAYGGAAGTLVGVATVKEDSLLNMSAYYDSFLSNSNELIGSLNSTVDPNFEFIDTASSLQVGVDSSESSTIKFTTNISLSSIYGLKFGKMEGKNSLENIDNFISQLSDAQTKLGAIENRLTSTLESISVNVENLTSSRSTLKDADVAKESSQLIKNQILQQASATLLATANQTPSLTLRLLNGM